MCCLFLLSFYCFFFFFFFFFNDTATTEIYTLSLHDALPICLLRLVQCEPLRRVSGDQPRLRPVRPVLLGDRKSTRLNSSHGYISYAVFCLKKKKKNQKQTKNRKLNIKTCKSNPNNIMFIYFT